MRLCHYCEEPIADGGGCEADAHVECQAAADEIDLLIEAIDLGLEPLLDE